MGRQLGQRGGDLRIPAFDGVQVAVCRRGRRMAGRRSPGICACEDDGQDQVLSEYILLPTAKLVAPRSVRAGDSFVRVSA